MAGLYTPVMLTTALDVPFGAVMRHGVKSARSAAEHTPGKKFKHSCDISVKKRKLKLGVPALRLSDGLIFFK